MAKLFNALIITLLIYSIKCTDNNVCVQKSPCLCEFSEYSKIDISQATQNQSPVTPDGFLQGRLNDEIFYFNGCVDGVFNLTAHGLNTTINNATSLLKGSLIHQHSGIVKVIGNSSQIKFNPASTDNGGEYDLIYKGANGSAVAIVHLICDNYQHPFINIQQNTSDEQILLFGSPHNCIVTHHPGLSTGSVLVILFLIAFGLYFICGGVIMYFVRGARGLEIIPNIDFWRGLPGLVKDGIIFLFSGCRAEAINTPETYDRI